MKRICSVLLILLLFSLTAVGLRVNAMNTDFITAPLPQAETDALLESLHLTLLTEEPSPQAIRCFAVSTSGMVAIGCGTSENKTVCIYTEDGIFQYGYRFSRTGNFAIGMDGDRLLIYLVRGDVAIAIDPQGQAEETLAIPNTSENSAYWRTLLSTDTLRVGDKTYTLRNKPGIFNFASSSHAQLLVTDAAGNTQILYDAGTAFSLGMAVQILIGLAFLGICVFLILWVIKKQRRIVCLLLVCLLLCCFSVAGCASKQNKVIPTQLDMTQYDIPEVISAAYIKDGVKTPLEADDPRLAKLFAYLLDSERANETWMVQGVFENETVTDMENSDVPMIEMFLHQKDKWNGLSLTDTQHILICANSYLIYATNPSVFEESTYKMAQQQWPYFDLLSSQDQSKANEWGEDRWIDLLIASGF